MRNLPPVLQLAFDTFRQLDIDLEIERCQKRGMNVEDATTMARLRQWHGRLDGMQFPIARDMVYRKEQEIRDKYQKVVSGEPKAETDVSA